jgi:hypothetical protein
MPPEDRVSRALSLRIAEQQALADLSWVVVVAGNGGPPEVRRERASREAEYRRATAAYHQYCAEHRLCPTCNGDGEWEIERGVIGPCRACNGTGWAGEEDQDE